MPILADNTDDNAPYDVVIKGGTIYSPSTDHELLDYNIGIIGSKIERITKEDIQGKQEIDARGLIVSPGFIDLISYDPNYVGIRLKVLDGVTSNLAMHGGTEDASAWYRAWGNNGVLTNYGASSFITRLRWPIVGYSVDAEMTEREDIEKLVQATRENIENGALGISFSLEYVPGIKRDEIFALLELAKEYDMPTFYHLRYSDEERGLEGLNEIIELGEETGAIIHIMHINSTGGTFVMDEALDMVKQARDGGLDISSCFYPYDYWATYLGSARFRDGWQERFKIDYEDLQIGGTDIRVTKDTFNHYRQKNSLAAAHGSLPESELIMLLEDSYTMIGSDTIIEPHYNNHPRGAGTYSRLFGRYVREQGVLSMMDAIKKASYFPAKRMESSAPSMIFKGRIEVGADADITIFNPDTIIDKATVADTAAPSEGIKYVIINGIITKNQDGIVPDVAPGKPIMSYFVDDIEYNMPIEYGIELNDGDKTIIHNAYAIDEKIYLPIDATMDAINIPVDNSKAGLITIKDDINIEIGDTAAHIGDENVLLTEEPIIYRGNSYILADDLELILNKYFAIEQRNKLLTFKDKEPKSTTPIKASTKPASPKNVQDAKVENSTWIFALNTIAILVLLYGGISFIAKHGKGRFH
ncbi:MAG: amidohydrolase family protein [Clostridiales bacterium]|nr:amidohydrolase family protein [Clostridiales bacterium]